VEAILHRAEAHITTEYILDGRLDRKTETARKKLFNALSVYFERAFIFGQV
jgi:hypothetical protein